MGESLIGLNARLRINMKLGPWEHRVLDVYWRGRPWNEKDGTPILAPSGLPRDVEDWGRLTSTLGRVEKQLRAAFLALGATDFRMSAPCQPGRMRECRRCNELFDVKRSTARYCANCRDSYKRKAEDPKFVEENRKRAREGMRKVRDPKRMAKVNRKIESSTPSWLEKPR